MIKKQILTKDYNKADYILIPGDREQEFYFSIQMYNRGKKIIQLWSGEANTSTHDDVYRYCITLMSNIQLCTNKDAENRVINLFKAVNKESNTFVVGNLMLDDLKIDEIAVPKFLDQLGTVEYGLILYNPETLYGEEHVKQEINFIFDRLHKNRISRYIWIEPNGDKYSELVLPYVNRKTLPRPQFLALIKNCYKFITNSSSEYYEAQFLMNKKDIIHVGTRNANRESKHSNMNIKNATKNIMNIFNKLKE